MLCNKAPGYPTLPLQGFQQPGPKPFTCYGCGEAGHRRGDAKCAAGPKDVWSGAPDTFKELIKKRGNDFTRKKFNGEKGDGGKQRNAKPEDVVKGICFNYSRGNGYCKYGDACKFKHEWPKGGGGGGKRKAALIVPKGVAKKKEKAKKKKVGKSFASMMAKGVKAMLRDEGGDEEVGSEEGGRSGEEDDSLFKLVRNASRSKKKRRVNFIVTLAGSNQDYVPSRWSSLMMTDQEGGDKFVPQRPRLNDDSKASASEKQERSVSSEDLLVDKGGELPAEEALAVAIAEGAKPRQKRKKSKKSKVGKSEVGALEEVGTSASSDWGKSNPPVRDWGMSTSPTCDSAGVTPVHNPGAPARVTERPSWGTMKDYTDDKRVDKEWGLWGKDAVRNSRDDKMRGRSPPPREKKGASDRMCEGGPWGEANARSESGWGSPR